MSLCPKCKKEPLIIRDTGIDKVIYREEICSDGSCGYYKFIRFDNTILEKIKREE